MKRKNAIAIFIVIIIALFSSIFFLTKASDNDKTDGPVTLLDHNFKEVTFPQEKPTLFFFLTTYTWGICQQQLVELHKNIDELKKLDIPIYVISKDKPDEQKELYNALVKEIGTSLPFISDPDFIMIDHMGMRNGDSSFRGYGLLDTDGNVVFTTVNDHYGEEFDQTIKEIKEEYQKLEK